MRYCVTIETKTGEIYLVKFNKKLGFTAEPPFLDPLFGRCPKFCISFMASLRTIFSNFGGGGGVTDHIQNF